MKILKDILYKAGLIEIIGSTDIKIEQVCFDSREVKQGSLFVAIKGIGMDGHDFIPYVVIDGVVAIVCEIIPKEKDPKVTYIKVRDSAIALGYIAANFYDNPSQTLKLLGVTGTNGKTTTVTLLHQLFTNLGKKSGLLSTVRNLIDQKEIKATYTTPDPITINRLLSEMVKAGCGYCFMEVSSHALVQKRIVGLTFHGALFTNITHDHLDYHKTFDAYIAAKKIFFDALNDEAFALINKDDSHWEVMMQNTKAKPHTYSLKRDADFKCKVVENQFSGLLLNIEGNEVWTKLIGSFNAYNLLAVYSAAVLLEEDKLEVLKALSNLDAVAGRFQYVRTESGVIGIVDYAHTPDALLNVLKTIADIRTGNEQVITVVGCGGDRDKTKRPLMAQIASNKSTRVILTSDNPRSEDPEKIIEQMQEGVDPVNYKKTISITERKEAIKMACSLAEAGDIILVAGKGHETYQEIKGKRTPFDDMQILREHLKIFEK